MAELGGSRRSAASNIYTVLMFIALIALLIGVVYVMYRNHSLYQSVFPLSLLAPEAVGPLAA